MIFDFERNKIRLIRGGKYPQCHSVLIDDEVRSIIDPACSKEKLMSIQRERPVDVIINSHGHEDHILYNYLFSRAQLWVHRLDAGVFKDKNAFVNQSFHPDDMDEKQQAILSQLLTDVVNFQPRNPDRLLEDGEILDFGQTRVRVLRTPGHLSFHFPDEGVIFFADLDLVKFGPYYADKASSIEDTISSLQRLAAIDADVYLVSHGKEGIMDGDPAHIQRYIDVIYQREEKLLESLAAGPKTLKEITARGIIYGGRSLGINAWDLSMSEKAMMRKHLDRLEKAGRITKEKDPYCLV